MRPRASRRTTGGANRSGTLADRPSISPRILPRAEHSISRRQIDPDALKVLYRLHRHGKLAYLVGGGVRDLLLGRRPKDFDIATDARPGEVKRLFRNSWIVGRRFRLVHVVFGTKVVEVATFRAEAEVTRPPGGPAGDRKAKERPDPGRAGASPHTLLVTWENTFGTPEQDAKRRDFTINALFYDISSYSLIDYVQGLKDLHRGMIRTIGDPDIRFQEDPVRMMRAVKFAARLEFRIESRTYASMRRHAAAIQLSAPPRVLEEIYRLLGSGKARKSFGLLHESGLLPHLIPEVASALKSDPQPTWSILDQLDRLMEQGAEPVSRALQMATLLDQVVRRECLEPAGPGDNLGERIQRVIRPLAQRLRMTRADTARMQQIFLAQRRFTLPKARRLSVNAFLKRGYFADSFQLFRMHALSTGEHQEDVASWEKRRHGVLTAEEIKPARERRRRMGAGRGRRRRRSRGGRVRTRS